MERAPEDPHPLRARLGLWDTSSIVIGIVIGVGIFQAPSSVFRNVSGPWEAMLVWVLGGLLSLIGALCFAELASTYPRSGGDYVYLGRAYGSWVGFLFAWAQLAVIRTGGGIAAPAYVFAVYACTLWNFGPGSAVLYAALAIAVLSLINILGVNPGKQTQNVLTVAKVLGLAGIILAGLCCARPGTPPLSKTVAGSVSFAQAMILVFYTYDGWNEGAYIAAEVHNRKRNLPLALVLGTAVVAAVYLLVNAAYLVGLGFEDARSSEAIAADTLSLAWGVRGARLMSVLVMISALGGINGMIFTGSRIYSEMGSDHPLFAIMGRWNPRLGTPAWSLIVQGVICIGLVGVVGAWAPEGSGFEALVDCTAPVFWLFFLLTSLSLVVLRFKDRDTPRPFRVPLYPVLPVIFCGWCGYMLYGSIRYAGAAGLVGLLILLAGLPLYWLSRKWPALHRHEQESKVEIGV